jgi:RNA polymerase sigma factor (TIGR02999 family)
MTEVTEILAAIEQGEPHAAEQLLPLVYSELRRLAARKVAAEAPGQTLQPTALVHEAYLRLVQGEGAAPQPWANRGHFFAAAAEAMRRILLNRARDKKRLKRAGKRRQVDLDTIQIAADTPSEDLLALDEALERLSQEDKLAADLVKLRFFAGLTQTDAAQALGLARRTADRCWAFARAWLSDAMRGPEEPAS